MDEELQQATTTTSEPYAQARHHTYLRGIITPLLSSSPIHSGINGSVRDDSIISGDSCFVSQQPLQQVQYKDELHPTWVQELAVLELSPDSENGDDDMNQNTTLQHGGNIVIFPGSVVPLRLLDQEWITYLQQQIHSITSSSTSTCNISSPATPVRFGILMPRPTGTDDDDDYDDNDQQNSHMHSSIPEQRHSWTRQAHGPNTLRRLSDQLIQALGPNFDYDDDDDDESDIDNDGIDFRNLNSTMITEPEATIVPTTATTTTTVQEDQAQPLRNDQERVVSHRNDSVSWALRRHRRQHQSSTGSDSDTRSLQTTAASTTARRATESTSAPVNERDQGVQMQPELNLNRAERTFFGNFGRFHSDGEIRFRQHIRRAASRNRRRDYQAVQHERQEQRNRRRRRSQSLSSSNGISDTNIIDRYIGRIGTVATVMYTHGNNDTPTDNNEHMASASSSLVITAIGTSRFRIIGYRNIDEQHEYTNARSRHQYHHFSQRRRHGSLKHFLIEEWNDVPMSLPIHSHLRHFPLSSGMINDEGTEPTTVTSLKYYKHYLSHLSIVSPYPKYILQKMWPWKIVADICQYIQLVAPTLLSGMLLPNITEQMLQQPQGRTQQNNETNDNTRNCSDNNGAKTENKHSNEDDGLDLQLHTMDPTAFSYWMATNLPFRYVEKIQQLEIGSTIERLQYIHDKLRNEELFAAEIHCIQCQSPLSFTYDMFTVDGADGTTGNYVNEYGHVHQTITLRSIDDNGVWYQGQPQSQDSWFPGYSWTIMACAICGHHLGWKFTTNGSTDNPSPQRPSTFYGVSAANIRTFVP